MRGCLFIVFSREGSLAQDGSKAIRVLGGVGSGAPFREDQRGVVEVRWLGVGETGKKMEKNHPEGNLLHWDKTSSIANRGWLIDKSETE